MDKPWKIMRRSIHTFLRQYHHLSSTPALILFPFSLALLLSNSLLIPSSPFFHTIHNCLQSVFHSAGFPNNISVPFFSLLGLKLSQTLSSSILTLPFALSFLLLAKSHVIALLLISSPDDDNQYLHRPAHLSASLRRRLYAPLLLTHLCNSFLLFSANATALSILFLAFNSLQALGIITSTNSLLFLSALGALLYSFILANAVILSNLALVVAGMDINNNRGGGGGGYWATLSASSSLLTTTRPERAATALSLTIPTNLALAAVEALFHYRVVKPAAVAYDHSRNFPPLPLLYEAALIAYIYSLLLLLDTIIGCTFYRACKSDTSTASSSSSTRLLLLDAAQHHYNIRPCRSYICYAAARSKSVDDRLP